MTDDDFINFTLDGKKGLGSPLDLPPSNAKGQVIERVRHTITKFRVYPNGMMSHPTSITWFPDQYGTIVKKKQPKKMAEAKESKMQTAEEY